MKYGVWAVFLFVLSAFSLPAVGPDAEDRFLTVNGLRLHYLDWSNARKPPF